MANTVTANEGAVITRAARHAALARLDELGTAEPVGDVRSFLVLAADHTTRDHPKSLYRPDGDPNKPWELKTPASLQSFVTSLVRITRGHKSRAHLGLKADQLTAILFELFENTHKHGRHASDGVTRLNPSIRVVRAEAHRGPKAELLAVASTRTLRAFVESTIDADRPNEQRGSFLEISVLDSGPGLAGPLLHKWAIESPTLDDEVRAIRTALRKHATTLTGPGRGLGLDTVQRLLTDLDGYMRIRTGRVDFERNYGSTPYDEREEVIQGVWNETTNGAPTSPATGTLVTLLIPVGKVGHR